MSPLYIALTLLFLLLTVGPKALFVLLLVSLLFIIGFIAVLIREGTDRRLALRRTFADWAHKFRFNIGLPFARDSRTRFDDSMYAEKHAMTKSEVLDPILEQILDNIVRDYVDSWYHVQISDDKLFGASLKRTARRTTIALRTCLSKVDWVPLLTRHIVDDFASHLRLYRKAKERLQLQKECSPTGRLDNLESVFFDLELEMERSYCRDLISTSPAYESAYLHDLCDILLYLLMPSEDFRSRPLRFLVREIFVSKVFVPLLDKLSDPSFVNRMIVWLLSELPISTEDFVASLEACKSVQELEAILEAVHEEINTLRSKGGSQRENSNIFSQQLASLEFTDTVIKRRMCALADRPESAQQTAADQQNNSSRMFPKTNKAFGHHLTGLELAEDASSLDPSATSGFVHLSIIVVLTHPLALSHFVEFLNQVGGQNYIDFYLAIEGFKVSMDHQLKGLVNGATLDPDAQETIREAALFMYHQYLSQEAITRVPLSETIINKFLSRLRNEQPSDVWFEQIQEKIVEVLKSEDRFYPAFKRHKLYERMLDELGISNNIADRSPTASATSPSTTGDEQLLGGEECSSAGSLEEVDLASTSSDPANPKMTAGEPSTTSVLVEMLGVGHQGRHLFALYNVRVVRPEAGGRGGSASNVIRRYSDFHSLHNLIVAKFPNLRTLSFPGKRTFNNLDQAFLEKRCRALNQYMNCILQPSLLAANPGLEALVFDFLTHKRYTGRESLPKAMSTFVFNPLVNGVKAFGNAAVAMPGDLIDGIGKMGSELNRAASSVLKGASGGIKQGAGSISRGRLSSSSTGNLPDSSSNRVAAHLDMQNDSAESIPLRVLLLLVDEVFGLRAKNQWFRRRLVSLLRQFIHAALGQSINRRIIDAVNWLTSEEQVAQYLVAFRAMATPAAAQDYHFNDKGHWVDQQGNRFRFVDQQHYDRMCAKMTEDLYGLLQDQCSMRKVNLQGERHVDEEESFVFISPNFETAHFLVVLINGSGAVRAGQWSRRLIVNESLDVGSQLPYIRQCIARGWAVLVANTNDNTYLDNEHDEAQTKQGSSDAIEHGQTVWRQLVVAKSAARRIALIAHSYGGHVVSEMLEAEKSPDQLRRIRAICLTDALYDSRTFDILKEQNANITIRNWNCSDTPLDTQLDSDESVSAGTQEHERSSAVAMESILRLIATKFNE